MRTIILLVIVAGTLYFSRNYIAGAILHFVAKRKAKEIDIIAENLKNGSVFSPKGTSRRFVFEVDIEEVGNGEVSISLAKKK